MSISNEFSFGGAGEVGGGGGWGRNKQNPETPGSLNFTLAQQGSLQFFLHQKLKKKRLDGGTQLLVND